MNKNATYINLGGFFNDAILSRMTLIFISPPPTFLDTKKTLANFFHNSPPLLVDFCLIL